MLNSMQSRFMSARTYQGVIKGKGSFVTPDGKTHQIEGSRTVRYSAPNKIYVQLRSSPAAGGEEEVTGSIVSDGRTFYKYSVKDNRYTKSKAPESFTMLGDLSMMVLIRFDLRSVRQVSTPTVNGRDCITVEATPDTSKVPALAREAFLKWVRENWPVQLTIDKSSLALVSIRLHGATEPITLSDQVFNGQISKGFFDFTPPVGATLEEPVAPTDPAKRQEK